jgi:hypothetical protein
MSRPSDEAAWSDQYLVECCQARDSRAWFELDRRFRGRLFRFACSFLNVAGNHYAHPAEEVTEKVLSSSW